MATTLSRRALLSGRIVGIAPAIRPPWAQQEEDFTDLCSRCGECHKACPSRIILKGEGGFPVVDFQQGECTFCAECVAHCPTGALVRPVKQSECPPWHLEPTIKHNCLALNRVVCRSCAEQCEQTAIRFRPAPGGIARPELTPEQCNGCGACIGPCPVAAIELHSLPTPGSTGKTTQEIVQ